MTLGLFYVKGSLIPEENNRSFVSCVEEAHKSLDVLYKGFLFSAGDRMWLFVGMRDSVAFDR